MKTVLEYCFVGSAIIGIAYWRQMTSQSLRVLAIYWALYVTVDLNLEQLEAGDGELIRLVYCLMHPISLAVYVYLFTARQDISKFNYWFEWILVAMVCAVSLFYIANNLKKETAANDIFLIQGICTLYVVLNYFRNIIFRNKLIYLSTEPLFWVATGILFYTTGNVIASGFYHQIYAYSKEMALTLYKLNYTLNVIMSIMFIIAFVISTKQVSTNPNGY